MCPSRATRLRLVSFAKVTLITDERSARRSSLSKMKYLIGALLVLLLVGLSEAANWALLVAGSNGYYNYRHQADICHSYQILHSHGIPDSHIVVMMYDDIANDDQNPTKGVIINKPGGSDVYHGVPKDYTGETVTPENFLKILQGQDMTGIGSGKTIKSGPDDYVFVNFADHGAPNILAFPSGELHAADLQAAILNMNKLNKYRQMVFYVEACESGSMFAEHKLPSNVRVFATTASNGEESSYACYWDDDRQTYLGDVYSVNWMEDSDKADFSKETLQTQFLNVKALTNTSHVMQYGDMTMRNLTIGTFQGLLSVKSNLTKGTQRSSIDDAVPSPEVPMMILYNRLRAAKTPDQRASILYEMEVEQANRDKIKKTVRSIVDLIYEDEGKKNEVLTKPAQPMRDACYKQAVTKFRNACFNFNKYEHALRHVYVFANLCDHGLATKMILENIEKVCRQ